MQLFEIGDILQYRDKSNWEVIFAYFESAVDGYMYELKSISNNDTEFEDETSLDKKAIVVKFSDKMPQVKRKLAKIYNLEDYRKKRSERLLNAQKGEVK